MNQQNQGSVFVGLLKRGYNTVFNENWPVMTGGVLIGILSIITFAWSRPWGVAGGLRNWGDWFFSMVGIYGREPVSPLLSSSSILTLGLLWGAFASALMSRQFSIRNAPRLELLKGMAGGTFMGIGSAMAGGCNVGGFYTATSALSLGGVAMMVGLIAGAYIGLKYLYWELERFPSSSAGVQEKPGGARRFDWLSIEPYLGAVMFLAAIAAAWIYNRLAYTTIGVLLLCGLGFGLIIQRCRFCFVRAFRDPLMTGEGDMARAVSVSIIISIIGFSVIKWAGLRGESIYITDTFWFGSLVGGIVFGFGMILAGGCGSGSVWRAGEGQVKLILAVIFFSLSISLWEALISASPGFASLIGRPFFLPDYLGYKWSVLVLILFFGFYYLLTTWNEETDKFTVQM